MEAYFLPNNPIFVLSLCLYMSVFRPERNDENFNQLGYR